MKYFVIYNSDGDSYIMEYTKEQLEKALNTEGHLSPDIHYYLDKIHEHNLDYWSDINGKRSILIIKGKVVTPKVGQLVME